MTSYANPAVYQCPACYGYLLRARLRSFNDYGVRYWSDGYATFSTLSTMSALVRCPSCPAVFWHADVEPIGEIPRRPMGEPRTGWLRWILGRWPYNDFNTPESLRDWDAAPPEWKDAQYDYSLSYADLSHALQEMAPGDPTREIFVRRRMWWMASDRHRIGMDGLPHRGAPDVPQAEAQENMSILLELQEADDGKTIERAELLRQLRRFDAAIDLLDNASLKNAPFDLHTNQLGIDIRRWAGCGDAGVKLLTRNAGSW